MSHHKDSELTINTRCVKKLKDLAKYNIDPFFLSPIVDEVPGSRNMSNGQFIRQITYILQKNVDSDCNVLLHRILANRKNKFNIDTYYNTLQALEKMPSNYPNRFKIEMYVMKNLQRISNRLMNLHLKECSMMQSHPNCTNSKYIQAMQRCYQEFVDDKDSNDYHYEMYDEKDCECILCERGSTLFNATINAKQRLYRYRLFNMRNHDYNYKKMLNFYFHNFNLMKNKQFFYCPFHAQSMSKSNSRRRIMNDMIIRHVSCCYLPTANRITLSIIQDLVDLAGIAMFKGYLKQAFEIGKIILNVSTLFMTVSCYTKLNHYERTGTVEVIWGYLLFRSRNLSSWKIFLSLFFHLLVDMNKIDLAIPFANKHNEFVSVIGDHKDDKSKDNLQRELFDFLIEQAPPSEFCTIEEYIMLTTKKIRDICKGDRDHDQVKGNLKLTTNSQLNVNQYVMLDKVFQTDGYALMKLARFEGLINCDKWRMGNYNLDNCNSINDTFEEQDLEKRKSTKSVIMESLVAPCMWSVTIFRDDNGHHSSASSYEDTKVKFDKIFEKIEQEIRMCNLNKWENLAEVNMKYFASFLYYAVFLFNLESKKACKYFEYCLQLRPLNGYLHYLYSSYLFKIVENYRLSYFHLKMAKKLNPNIYILNQMSDKYAVLKKQNVKIQLTMYQLFMILLCKKLDKQHKCNSCNKILSVLNTCRGCRCVFYCSRRCQKIDWTQHKQKCIAKCEKIFDHHEIQVLHNIELLLNESVKRTARWDYLNFRRGKESQK